MPLVHFVKQKVTVECPVGTNLRELALGNDIDLYAFPNNIFNCRGFACAAPCVKGDEPARCPLDAGDTSARLGWEGRIPVAAIPRAGRLQVITNRSGAGLTNPPIYH